MAKGRFSIDPRDVRAATTVQVGGLALARLGRLLPAVVSVTADPRDSVPLRDLIASGATLSVTSAQIEEMARSVDVRVTQVSEGPVPLAEAEYARFVFFREAHGLLGHVAVLVGRQRDWPDPVPVRIHSACLTGDLFGSLRCDCGEQLRGSLRYFAGSGGGVLLYMGPGRARHRAGQQAAGVHAAGARSRHGRRRRRARLRGRRAGVRRGGRDAQGPWT